MRKSSPLLAFVTLAGCSQSEIAATTQTGGMSVTDSDMTLAETGATPAPTTSGGAITNTSGSPPPGGPPTTADPSTSSGATTGTTGTTGTIGTIGTTGMTGTTSGASTEPLDTTGSAESTGDATTGAAATTGPEPEPPWAPKPCPALYDQDLLPTFELEISKKVLSKLKAEWTAGAGNAHPDHPVLAFKYQDQVVTTATVQLRGNPKWWPQMGKKMQLEVSFNTFDKKGRFMGLRKLLFDAARYNESFLRDRLALAILRDVGLPAPCANNARVVINGEYLGLFTSLEKPDKEFLERHFEDPEGNLYKRDDWEKKTNEMDTNISDLEALLGAKQLDDLLAVMNLEEALLEWATEAVIPDGDGPWAGGLNWYAYNDPKTGFNVIPWDLDATFTRLPANTDPYTYQKPDSHGRPFYKIATDDPAWFKKYIEKVAYVVEHGYKVDVLQARMDTWAAQIATAAAEDKNKPFPTSDHINAVQEQRDYVAARAAYLKKWLACWQNGGTKGKGGKCKPK